MLISHVDLRVSDRARAEAFYDPILAALGAEMRRFEVWSSFRRAGEGAPHWVGFTEDATAKPCATRVAFAAKSRAEVDAVAALLPQLGAGTIEGPDMSEDYYAVFFEDPDGNRLEVAYIEE